MLELLLEMSNISEYSHRNFNISRRYVSFVGCFSRVLYRAFTVHVKVGRYTAVINLTPLPREAALRSACGESGRERGKKDKEENGNGLRCNQSINRGMNCTLTVIGN